MSRQLTSPLPPSVLKNLGERLYLPSNLFAAEEDPPPQVLVKASFLDFQNSLAKESNVSSTHLAIILKPKKDVCGGRLLDTLRQSPLQNIASSL